MAILAKKMVWMTGLEPARFTMRVYQFRHIHTALMDYKHLLTILQAYNQIFFKKIFEIRSDHMI